jgi:5-formyltetrahydrofolate cyclo-ligase
MLKSDIRKTVKERKLKLTKEEQEKYSDIITNCLSELSEYRMAERIFCYVNFNQEVITLKLIEKALSDGIKVAVPKITNQEMHFYYISSIKELKPGFFGIPEPVTTTEAVPEPNKTNLFIVPGLAFDPGGNRIGYGKGYYDRYFKKYKNCPMEKIGLAYEFQIFFSLPVQKQDVKMNQIITQNRIIKIIG